MKVLISRGYGAGWSTWNQSEMAIDKDLIALFEQGCSDSEMEEACKEKGYGNGFGGPYMGGFDGLIIEEVPAGTFFKIREYDGSEYIEIFNTDSWYYANE